MSGNPTTQLTAVGGVADFTHAFLNIDLVGADKVILASKNDRSGAGGAGALSNTSNVFAITLGPAASVAFSTQPGDAVAGANLSPQPVVQIRDAAGNIVDSGPDATAMVTLSVASGTGPLLGTASRAAVAGVATFSGLSFQQTGAKTLTATKADTTASIGGTAAVQVTSNALNITPAAASQLVFTTQPGSATAGAIFAQQPILVVQDAFGNTVDSGADSHLAVAVSLSTGTGPLQGTTPVTASAGVATFTDLQIDKSNAAAVITASATLSGGSGVTVLSNAFSVSPAVASALVLTTQPGGGVSNTAWATQPVVSIQDAYANVITSGVDSTAVVTFTLTQGTGKLTGNVQQAAVNGVADFSGAAQKIDLTGVNKKITATAVLNNSPVTVVSNVFTITNGVGTTLTYTTQPTGAVAGHNFATQPVLQVLDAAGNLVTSGTDATATVTLTLGSGSALAGVASIPASGGVASFSGLSSQTRVASDTLVATATLNGLPKTATSNTFAITPEAASHVVFTTQPSASTVSLVPFAQQPIVTITDTYGNVVDTGADATAIITLSLSAGTGTLSGNPTTALTAVNGVADFTNAFLNIDLTGADKVITASKSDTSGGGGTAVLTGTSNVFAITQGTATSLVFASQPSAAVAGVNLGTQPVLEIRDAAGNVVTTGPDAGAVVSLTLASGTGTILGTASATASSGVATFTDIHLQVVGTKVLTATKADTTASIGGTIATYATSSSFVISPAGASQLVFVTQPKGAVAGAAFASQPVIQVQDPYGNLVTSGGDAAASIGLSLSSGVGPLQGTTPVFASGGIATFAGLEIDTANAAAILTASATLGGVGRTTPSTAFAVSPAVASALVMTTQPGGGVSNTAWTTQPVVKIEDAYGNVITSGIDGAAVVSLTLTQGTGTLAGTAQKAAVNGVASFVGAGLQLDLTGTNKKLTASATVAGTTLTVVSNVFTITNGVGTTLVFSTQPTGAVAGNNFATQPVVRIYDAAGNLVTAGTDATAAVTLTLGSASSLSGTAMQPGIAGVATFSGLSSQTAVAAETLVASATLNSATVTQVSNSFAITPDVASQVVFTRQPSASTASLVPFAAQPVVTIEDQYGNTVSAGPDATATITLTLNGGGTLSGNPTTQLTAVAGVADFTTALLSVDLSGTGKTLTATKANTVGGGGTVSRTVNSSSFDITGGAASSLIFSAQPGAATAGANLGTQPTVQILDPAGNGVTSGPDATAVVTLSLASGTGALLGTATATASGGVATFSGLAFNIAGAKTLTATKADTSASIGGTAATTVTSNSFIIGPATASQLVFTTQPGSATAGAIFGSQPVVTVQDPYGNTVDSGGDSTASVILSLSTGTGPVGGTLSKTAVAGVATFTNLEIDKMNAGAVLTATATLATVVRTATSNAFAVSPAAASVLVFTTQPGGGVSNTAWTTQPVVKVQDAYSNVITTGLDSTAVVRLSLTQGTGSLAGTRQVAAVAGVATFAGLSLDLTGINKQVTASATLNGSPVTVVSNSFTITNGVGTALVFSTQPVGAVAGVNFATQPTVQVRDAAGNVVTSGTDATASIELTLGSGSTLYGTALNNAGSGVLAFSGLNSHTAQAAETLVAAATLNGAAVTVTSSSFAITAAAAAQLVFTTQPSASSVSLVAFASQPVVKIEDSYGNLVTTGIDATASITLTLSGGTGVLGGNPGTALSATGGVADFSGSGLNIDLVGANKVITASKADTTGGGGTGSMPATSNTFAITAGPIAQAVFTTQPVGANAGSNFATQPIVTLQDAAGNPIVAGADATANVTLSVASGTGSLAGTATVAASNGVATFSGLSMSVTGSKILLATKADTTPGGTPALTGTSSSFTISPSTTTHLVFATQPGGGTAGTAWGVQPVVRVVDASGNIVDSGPDSSVSITVSLTTGSGVLAGTLSQTAVNGVATFTNVSTTTANATAGITANTTLSGGSASVVSNTFTVVPAPATTLAFGTQPGGGTAGTAWATQPIVNIKDSYGNICTVGTDGTAVVSLALTQGTGTLSGTALMAAVAGVADFTGKTLRLDLVGTNKKLTATATLNGAPLTVVSNTFTITNGVGTQLAFRTQPGGATAGSNFSPQPVVTVLDANGNTVVTGTGSAAAITLALGSASTLYGTATGTATAGVLSFAGLNSRTATTAETLVASATLNGASVTLASQSFAVTAGPATQVVFTTQPSASTVALVPFASQPVAKIEDQYGNVVTSGPDSTATVTLTLTTGTGTLAGINGTALSAVGGVADFSSVKLNIDLVGTNKVITATKASTTASGGTAAGTPATTNAFTITNGTATQVVFITQPGGVNAGNIFSPQPVINILDAAGNIVSTGVDATASVTMALTSGTGTLLGTLTQPAVAGVATFTDLQDNASGSKVITATKANTTGGGGTLAVSVASGSFSIGFAAASKLAFAVQPASGTAGQVLGVQPTVQVQDTYNNPVTTGGDAAVSIGLTLTAGNGALAGTVLMSASGGNATFTNVRIDANNLVARITASATIVAGSVSVQSNTFTVVPGPATTLYFATQPSGGTSSVAWATQPVVQVRDSYLNVVTTGTDSTDTVTLTLTTGTGVLSGTTANAAVAGVADFTGKALKIDLVGTNKVLTAAATLGGSPVTATSNAFTITNAPASQIVFATQPNTAAAGSVFGAQPVINILDAAGNLVTSAPDATANVTMSINTGTGSLITTLTKAAVGGVATFTNLQNNTAQTNLSLTATKADTTPSGTATLTANSNAFIVFAGPGALLGYAVQPGTQTAGITYSPAPVVTIMDAYNNPVISGTDSTGTVAVSLTAGGGTAVGTLSVAASGGNAVFSNISSGLYSTTNVLTASATLSGGSPTVASNVFTVNKGPASQLVFTTQPGGGPMGTVWAQQPAVSVTDANSNVITTGGDSGLLITLSQSAGSGSLLGTPTATATSGVATFSGLYHNQQGPHTLTATATASGGAITGNSNQYYTVTGNKFTADYSFAAGTQSDYSFGNPASLALTGNSVTLAKTSVADTNATNFSAGTMSGVQYDAVNGILRLGNTNALTGCDATTTNCAEMDPNWVPRYTSLFAYYKFNGTGFTDDGGTIAGTVGPNLTAHNPGHSGLSYVPGKFNQALLFDGSDDGLTFANNPNTDLTLSAWYKWTDPGVTYNSNTFFRLYSPWGRMFLTVNNGWPAVYGYIGGASSSGENGSSPGLVTNGSWRHVVMTMGNNVAAMYLDGKELRGTYYTSFNASDMAPFSLATLGWDGSGSFFKGQIDEFALWNVSLTTQEVASLYTRQYPSYAGMFTSQVFDGLNSNATWSSVGWNTTLPFAKPLPSNRAIENTASYPQADAALEQNLIMLWHMDEPFGQTGVCDMVDDANGTNCGYFNAWGYGAPAVFGTGFYVENNASNPIYARGNQQVNNPNNFTQSIWFNVASNLGGGLLGYFNDTQPNAAPFDRLLHVTNDGHVVYWIWDDTPNVPRSVISLAGNYNDQRWHHAVGTQSTTAGIALYVDGVYQGSDPNGTSPENHTGWWIAGSANPDPTHLSAMVYHPTNAGLTGYIDEAAIFNRVLSPQEIQHLYRRGSNRVRAQVRSCAQAGCADNPSWVGPDGTSGTFFTEINNVTANTNFVLATPPNLSFSNFSSVTIPNNRYFQYKLMLESDNTNLNCYYAGGATTAQSACSPEVTAVTIGPSRYDPNTPSVTSLVGQSYGYLTGFDATYTGCTGSGVTFNLSPDGINWYYYTAGNWTAASGTQSTSNTIAQLTASAMNAFSFQVGTGSVYFKAFLLSDGSTPCALNDVHIGGTQLPAYTLSGNVTGLIGNGITLVNGSDAIYLPSDGNFVFDQAIVSGASYTVALSSPPPGQTCVVNNATGTITNANVVNVNIVCNSTATYTVGGNLTGLTSGSVTFILNGDTQTLSSNGAWTMPTTLAHGQPYSVVVTSSPTAQNCTVVNGSGTIGSSNVSNVVVSCSRYLKFGINQNATLYEGQTSATGTGTGNTASRYSGPQGQGYVSGAGILYMPDTANCRVLIFNTVPATSNASANFSVGKATLSTASCPIGGNPSASSLYRPTSVSAYKSTGTLIVDSNNNRVMLYATAPVSNANVATGVLGQTSMTTNAAGCSPLNMNVPLDAVTNGNALLVADARNNRVMVWTTQPSTTAAGTPANFVLGQPDMNTCTLPSAASNTLNSPQGLWTDGNFLLITDTANNRLVVYYSLQRMLGLGSNYQSADMVVGQGAFTNNAAGTLIGMTSPQNAVSDGTHIYVSDKGNNRILVYNAVPTALGAVPDSVIGQTAFSNLSANQGGTASSLTMSGPRGVSIINNNLWVADTSNNRFLVFVGQ